jgi:hypothetical protein
MRAEVKNALSNSSAVNMYSLSHKHNNEKIKEEIWLMNKYPKLTFNVEK